MRSINFLSSISTDDINNRNCSPLVKNMTGTLHLCIYNKAVIDFKARTNTTDVNVSNVQTAILNKNNCYVAFENIDNIYNRLDYLSFSSERSCFLKSKTVTGISFGVVLVGLNVLISKGLLVVE